MDWEIFRNDDIGVAMLIQPDVAMQERDGPPGWTTLKGDIDGTNGLDVLAKLGDFPAAKKMEAVAAKALGFPAKTWTLVDQGEGGAGWKWYRTHLAKKGKKQLFLVVGHGERGSYLVGLRTWIEQFDDDRALYLAWYSSIIVY